MRLYRYQPINKLTLINLSLKSHWAADPASFNDPFEFVLRSEWYMDNEYKMRVLSEDKLAIRERVKIVLDRCGVISYSKERRNKLLWSHYADHHKGMCLGFEMNEDDKKLVNNVKYVKDLPEFDFGKNPFDRKKGISKIILTKSIEWKYEKEYREITLQKNVHSPYTGKLVEISFGCRCPFQDIQLVRRTILPFYGNEIQFSKFKIHQDSFNLSEMLTEKTKNDNDESFRIAFGPPKQRGD